MTQEQEYQTTLSYANGLIERLRQEHEKELIALEQEINGWKAANRILNARIEQYEEALRTISEESDDQGARDCAMNALKVGAL